MSTPGRRRQDQDGIEVSPAVTTLAVAYGGGWASALLDVSDFNNAVLQMSFANVPAASTVRLKTQGARFASTGDTTEFSDLRVTAGALTLDEVTLPEADITSEGGNVEVGVDARGSIRMRVRVRIDDITGGPTLTMRIVRF